MTTRRDFAMTAIAPFAAAALSGASRAEDNKSPLAKMGIASTSFMGTSVVRQSVPPTQRKPGSGSRDTLQFLERCHALGASGIQAQITGDVHKLRARAEKLGMWVEAMVSIRNSSPERLEQLIVNAKEAGCTVARDGLLGGRRYETFNTLADWNAWVEQSLKVLKAAIPVFEKHRFTLAMENHKDWTLDQYVNLFKTYSSEYFGACIDFGNNIALLDDLTEVIEGAAPYAKATHLKDVGVTPYDEGFLLSEVPLGTGVLNLPEMVRVVQKANPNVRFSLEMITRDPLKVPCLTDHYWVTFPDRNGRYLAHTLRFVREHKSKAPLPTPEELPVPEHAKVEEENIKACFRYAQTVA